MELVRGMARATQDIPESVNKWAKHPDGGSAIRILEAQEAKLIGAAIEKRSTAD